jgi:hypothetical protein
MLKELEGVIELRSLKKLAAETPPITDYEIDTGK